MIDVLVINETRLTLRLVIEKCILMVTKLFDVIQIPMVDLAEEYAFISVIA